MIKKKMVAILFVLSVLILSGCAPIIVGGAAVSAGTGTYFYINGELKTDYHFPFDTVWNACEKTVAYMHALDVVPMKEISGGIIDASIEEEKVHIAIQYKAKNLTTVAVRVGLLGDQRASQRLHDKIAEFLLEK